MASECGRRQLQALVRLRTAYKIFPWRDLDLPLHRFPTRHRSPDGKLDRCSEPISNFAPARHGLSQFGYPIRDRTRPTDVSRRLMLLEWRGYKKLLPLLSCAA